MVPSSINIPMLVKGIKAVAMVYKQAGFCWITMALMDGKSEEMCGDLADIWIALNKTARDKHVSDIKQFIHMLRKERM